MHQRSKSANQSLSKNNSRRTGCDLRSDKKKMDIVVKERNNIRLQHQIYLGGLKAAACIQEVVQTCNKEKRTPQPLIGSFGCSQQNVMGTRGHIRFSKLTDLNPFINSVTYEAQHEYMGTTSLLSREYPVNERVLLKTRTRNQ